MPASKAFGPDAGLYGIWERALAQRLASQSGDPTVDAIRGLRLQGRAMRGNENYLEALAQANATQQELDQMAHQADMAKAYLEHADDFVKSGMKTPMPVGMQNYLIVDEPDMVNAAAYQRAGVQADNVQKIGAGVNALSDAGYGFAPEDVGYLITPPDQAEPIQTIEHVNPSDQASQLSAEASMLNAKANMVDATNPKKYSNKGGGSDDDGKYKIHYIMTSEGPRPMGMEYSGKGTPPGAVPMAPGGALAGTFGLNPLTGRVEWMRK